MDINELLNYTVLHNASDLHLSSGMKPIVRIDDELERIPDTEVLAPDDIITMMRKIVPKNFYEQISSKLDIDLSIFIPELARFRVNVFQQNRGISVALRNIPLAIPTISDLKLPDIFYKLCDIPNGLILVTGPTGCGKTTTLAAMIDYINSTQRSHILTIEDPVEYVHASKKCLVQQREVGKDTESFDIALRAALREDPDYILVGEMRDLETIRLALTAAETGHLVFATIHTNTAAESIDRIIDVFPSFEKSVIRAMVANSLQAVVSQVLIKKPSGGRVAAHEIMICTPAIRNMIRENKIPQIVSAIQTGQDKGMRTLEQNLQELLDKSLIDIQTYRKIKNSFA